MRRVLAELLPEGKGGGEAGWRDMVESYIAAVIFYQVACAEGNCAP
ncbi:hypothetical protein [Rhizobium tibeticum]|nr:hypothetical protein [Rhizobium tibeticum]